MKSRRKYYKLTTKNFNLWIKCDILSFFTILNLINNFLNVLLNLRIQAKNIQQSFKSSLKKAAALYGYKQNLQVKKKNKQIARKK